VTWTNHLLGEDIVLPGADAGAAALLQGGSGRVWYQEGQVRLESQGQGARWTLVCDGRTLWIYDGQANKATEYTLPERPADSGDEPAFDLPADLPGKIQEMIDKPAPAAALAVEQARIAGRAAYVLTLTPTAEDTVFGSLRVAIDGERFVPLGVEVFAKGQGEPTLAAGFTRVSFDPAPEGAFTFTAPEGATIERKALSPPPGFAPFGGEDRSGQYGFDGESRLEHKQPLTLEEAQQKAGFDLLTPADTRRAFAGAHVFSLGDEGPLVLSRYGEGFGTVLLAQLPTPEGMPNMRQQMFPGMTGDAPPSIGEGAAAGLGTLLGLGELTLVGGAPGFVVETPLGTALVWQRGDLTVAALGSLSADDLVGFATGLR